MKKSDLLEAWKKVCKYPENNDAIGCINDLLENLPDDEPKECEHEWVIIGKNVTCQKCDVSLAICEPKAKTPEWEETIDKWFAPQRLFNIEYYPATGEKIFVYDGKPLGDLVKTLFREEMKKLGEQIIEKYNSTSVFVAVNEALKERGVEK